MEGFTSTLKGLGTSAQEGLISGVYTAHEGLSSIGGSASSGLSAAMGGLSSGFASGQGPSRLQLFDKIHTFPSGRLSGGLAAMGLPGAGGSAANNSKLRGARESQGTSTSLPSMLMGGGHAKNFQSKLTSVTKKKQHVNLQKVNFAVKMLGSDAASNLNPLALTKSGIAAEKLMQFGMDENFVRVIIKAVFLTQEEHDLRRAFEIFDLEGMGNIAIDEMRAIFPLLGEDIPDDLLEEIFNIVDTDESGELDFEEFSDMVKLLNPLDDTSSWEQVCKKYAHRRKGRLGNPEARDELATYNLLEDFEEMNMPSKDVDSALQIIHALEESQWIKDNITTFIRTLFLTQSDSDLQLLFQILDKDRSGMLGLREFGALAPLMGDKHTPQDMQELFRASDPDGSGFIEFGEFKELIWKISPKQNIKTTAKQRREAATKALKSRIELLNRHKGLLQKNFDADGDLTVKVLFVGSSGVGKTYCLNEITDNHFPSNKTVDMGYAVVPVNVGNTKVIAQVFDSPGDPRFAPLAEVFYGVANYCVMMYDNTESHSFDILHGIRDKFLSSNPSYDVERLACVGNRAHPGFQRHISAKFAKDWCENEGGIPCFHVEFLKDGLLEVLRHICVHYINCHPELNL